MNSTNRCLLAWEYISYSGTQARTRVVDDWVAMVNLYEYGRVGNRENAYEIDKRAP